MKVYMATDIHFYRQIKTTSMTLSFSLAFGITSKFLNKLTTACTAEI